jgi:hypothetical protein
VGIEPTYQKQQVISLFFERTKYINKLIYRFKIAGANGGNYSVPPPEIKYNSVLPLLKTIGEK